VEILGATGEKREKTLVKPLISVEELAKTLPSIVINVETEKEKEEKAEKKGKGILLEIGEEKKGLYEEKIRAISKLLRLGKIFGKTYRGYLSRLETEEEIEKLAELGKIVESILRDLKDKKILFEIWFEWFTVLPDGKLAQFRGPYVAYIGCEIDPLSGRYKCTPHIEEQLFRKILKNPEAGISEVKRRLKEIADNITIDVDDRKYTVKIFGIPFVHVYHINMLPTELDVVDASNVKKLSIMLWIRDPSIKTRSAVPRVTSWWGQKIDASKLNNDVFLRACMSTNKVKLDPTCFVAAAGALNVDLDLFRVKVVDKKGKKLIYAKEIDFPHPLWFWGAGYGAVWSAIKVDEQYREMLRKALKLYRGLEEVKEVGGGKKLSASLIEREVLSRLRFIIYDPWSKRVYVKVPGRVYVATLDVLPPNLRNFLSSADTAREALEYILSKSNSSIKIFELDDPYKYFRVRKVGKNGAEVWIEDLVEEVGHMPDYDGNIRLVIKFEKGRIKIMPRQVIGGFGYALFFGDRLVVLKQPGAWWVRGMKPSNVIVRDIETILEESRPSAGKRRKRESLRKKQEYIHTFMLET